MNKRKRKYMSILVSPETIAQMFTLNRGKAIRVFNSSIPKSAKYVSCYYDFERDSFIMCFYHGSFPVVPDGERVPIVLDTKFEYWS